MRKIDSILSLLRNLTNSKTDKEMCEILKIPYGTLDNWKARDNIPKGRLYEFSEKFGVSMDTLLNGSVKVTGDNNLAFSGDGNTVFDKNADIANVYSPKVNEFLALYKKYGNKNNENLDKLLDPIIEKLKQIEKISNG